MNCPRYWLWWKQELPDALEPLQCVRDLSSDGTQRSFCNPRRNQEQKRLRCTKPVVMYATLISMLTNNIRAQGTVLVSWPRTSEDNELRP